MDIGAQVPHAALRFYVMGERGADHATPPTEDEIDRMGVLLEEALNAGALGFTTSRTIKHRAADGRSTPSLSAREPELFGLAQAMKRAGRGVIEVNSDFGPGEFEILRARPKCPAGPFPSCCCRSTMHRSCGAKRRRRSMKPARRECRSTARWVAVQSAC